MKGLSYYQGSASTLVESILRLCERACTTVTLLTASWDSSVVAASMYALVGRRGARAAAVASMNMSEKEDSGVYLRSFLLSLSQHLDLLSQPTPSACSRARFGPHPGLWSSPADTELPVPFSILVFLAFWTIPLLQYPLLRPITASSYLPLSQVLLILSRLVDTHSPI